MTDASPPRLLVEAFECLDGPGAPVRRSIGMLDVTDPITEALLYRRLAFPAPERIAVGLFSSALGREAADVAWGGRLAVPGFAAAIDRFVAAIGGLGQVRDFRRHLKAAADALAALERAEELRSTSIAAAFVQAGDLPEEPRMFHCPLGSAEGDYVGDPSDAYPFWRHAEYERLHPRPKADFDAPETVAWREAYAAWARTEKPPMVFLTNPVHFAGVDASTIREAYEDEGKVDLPDILTSACDDHHEDAIEEIVDEGALHALVAAWISNAGKGTPEDLALEAGIAEWNGRQTMVSYEADPTRCTGTSPDVDAAEIARWCDRHVERTREALARARIWSAAQPGADLSYPPQAA